MGMKTDMGLGMNDGGKDEGRGGPQYSEVTRAISVSVDPFYVEEQSEPAENRWVFGYRVIIENQGPAAVQLMSRHWRIMDGRGRTIEVKGDGVVGEQPMLEPGESFEYTSGTPLPTPSGIMTGTYQMLGEDGLWFDVEIPTFSLDAPGSRGTVN
jgi:ApaG protein